MEADSVKINKHIEIRKPEPSDLEEEIRLEPISIAHRRRPIHPPSAIIHLETRERGQSEVLGEIEKLASVLRFFRLGSVFRTRVEWNPVSILQGLGTSFSLEMKPKPFDFTLNKEDEDNLKIFFERIEPKIEEITAEKESFLTIALDRYEDALVGHKTPEARLTSAIMCLEALYIKDEERGELKERLGRRTGLALGFLGFNPIEVSRKIKN